MTVSELLKEGCFTAVCISDDSREVTGVYIGDLLSWVMGRAASGDAWITIMTNINILAVASLADTSCIILAEGTKPDLQVIETAKEKGINILSSEKSSYDIAVCMSKFL